MTPWCDVYQLAVVDRQDWQWGGLPLHDQNMRDMRLALRAAWHGAMHAFEGEEREEMLAAIASVEKACA